MSEYEENEGELVVTHLKWFEPRKGFGFVHDPKANIDAFLHFSVLRQSGYEQLAPGTTITCRLIKGPKGQQVSSIESIDVSTATEESEGAESSYRDSGGNISEPVEAEVKFFNVIKGFGFAKVAGLENDVFLPGKLLPHGADIQTGQNIRLTYREGNRGLMAVSIELL